MPHVVAVFEPGSAATCSPPPVQPVCCAALPSTHLAVTSEPHAFTPVAHNKNAEAACSPSRPIVPCDFATISMYCLTAGTWAANSNGTPLMRTYTLSAAPPFCPFHLANAAVYWFGSVAHALGANPTCFEALRKFSRLGSGDPTQTT